MLVERPLHTMTARTGPSGPLTLRDVLDNQGTLLTLAAFVGVLELGSALERTSRAGRRDAGELFAAATAVCLPKMKNGAASQRDAYAARRLRAATLTALRVRDVSVSLAPLLVSTGVLRVLHACGVGPDIAGALPGVIAANPALVDVAIATRLTLRDRDSISVTLLSLLAALARHRKLESLCIGTGLLPPDRNDSVANLLTHIVPAFSALRALSLTGDENVADPFRGTATLLAAVSRSGCALTSLYIHDLSGHGYSWAAGASIATALRDVCTPALRELTILCAGGPWEPRDLSGLRVLRYHGYAHEAPGTFARIVAAAPHVAEVVLDGDAADADSALVQARALPPGGAAITSLTLHDGAALNISFLGAARSLGLQRLERLVLDHGNASRWLDPRGERQDGDPTPAEYAAVLRSLPPTLRELHVPLTACPGRDELFVALTSYFPRVTRLCVTDAHGTLSELLEVLEGVALVTERRVAVRFSKRVPALDALRADVACGRAPPLPCLATLDVPWGAEERAWAPGLYEGSDW